MTHKPHGPIPTTVAADADGMLMIGGVRADALAATHGTPLFVYDMAVIRQRLAALRSALPAGVGIHYAIKANPLPALLAATAPLIDGFDIASGGELVTAIAAGMAPDHISFAGPGKTDRELEAAIAARVTLNLESATEAARAIAIAARLGIVPRLAVRVNPDFDLKGSGMRMGGGARPFGVDAAAAPALVRHIIDAGADWRGLHIFAGSQSLDSAAIAETQAATVALAASIAREAGAIPPLVNLGGGFGVTYFPNDRPVDIDRIGESLARTLAARDPALATTRFVVELGRWIAADCGVYVSRIVDKKMSHGRGFLILDGGLHHQLAASGNFGTVIRRNYPICIATRFGMPTVDGADAEVVDVVGCLCTPLDRLGDQVLLPRAEVGDLVALFMAGAYGASASPAAFLGHSPAPEVLLGA